MEQWLVTLLLSIIGKLFIPLLHITKQCKDKMKSKTDLNDSITVLCVFREYHTN